MKSTRQIQREVDDFLRSYRSRGSRGHARKTEKKFACPNCDGGLVLEDPAYGLVCPACEIRVAGPFESGHEIPDYKPARRGLGGEVLLPKRRTGHAQKLPSKRGKALLSKKLPPPKKLSPKSQPREGKDLRKRLQRLIDKWQPRLGIHVDKWNLRKMKKYWGSSRRPGCDAFACREGHITFNTEMAKLPERHQEYLVVHELVHQVTDGHDAKFYRLMDRHLPGWREMQAQIEEPLTRYS